MSARAYDVIVIGAGIVGAAAARELARAGLAVLVLERGWPGGGEATAAAAGMLAPQVEAATDDPLLPLGVAARNFYATFVTELEREGATRLGYRACGVALVAFDAARAGELRAQVAAQRACGLEAEWLDRPALVERHPGIGPAAVGALLAPRDGAIDNVALGAALRASGARAGVAFAEGEQVVELLARNGRVAGVRTSRGTREAGTVVVAAGAWTPAILGLPRTVPIAPVRGQMLQVPWPAGEPDGVLFGNHAYALRRGDDAILGSTMEWVGFDPANTEEGTAHILHETGALLPAVLGQPVTKLWAGLRPMTADGRPIVGRDPDVAGLVWATGHGRNGILLGPLTGAIVRDLVVKGEAAFDLAPFAMTRFAQA